ncbi:hypothetical protein CNYM01_13755 [Colletotrichum nymphaeae SA-01]|uniref:C2H2-type domain-containing protein n=1 Tax=Colletotrichum nymphaeae SA-01 TaxID=1460502 RepID=A0A135T1J3_9PEZI|nr:hypothetical protein CNYM01_13755 [Colletotrichum nymphaeae SA-01]
MPGSQANMSPYQPQQQKSRGSCQQMGWYPHPVQASRPRLMLPLTTMAFSSRRSTAPFPTSAHVLPALCPVTADGIMPQPGENYPYCQGGVMLNGIDEVKRPIYAVGSQRRRGILSSALDCPGVTVAGTCNSKSTCDPVKNVGGKLPCPYCNTTYMRKSHLKLYLLRHRLDDGGYQDGRHLTDSAIDVSGQVGKMQKYNMPVQDETFSQGGPDVDQQTGLDGIQFCHVHQSYEIRIRLPPISVESIRGPCGQLNYRESLLYLIWKVLAAASLDDLIVFGSASQHHEEACETSSATEKYIQYLEHFDVFTGMSSIPHTAPDQLHLHYDYAMDVYPKAQS